MKNLKVNFFAIVLVLGIGTAFATASHHRLDDRKWARDPMTGVYTDITGQQKGDDYQCNGNNGICTAEYPADVNPNNQGSDQHPGTVAPDATELGSFVQ